MTDELIRKREEQARIILDTALRRIRELGFGVVADGTVHGDGVWINELRLRYVGREEAEP